MAEQEIREQILIEMAQFELPEYERIPDVGLFLEQVVRYTEGFMKPIDAQPLTGSMISNYVKHKIITNPVKKQYGREQIAALLYIMVAKTVLSLEDIQLLLQMQKATYPVKTAYEYFRTELMYAMQHPLEYSERIAEEDAKNREEKLLVHSMITTVVHKFFLDLYFKKIRPTEG